VIHEQGSKEWLVVYDRKHTGVLAVEKGKYSGDGHRKTPLRSPMGGVARSRAAWTGVAGSKMRPGKGSAHSNWAQGAPRSVTRSKTRLRRGSEQSRLEWETKAPTSSGSPWP
jgi:hypothetical protein